MEKNQKPIIGGIFGTHTEWDENGNVTVKDDFHLRIYWDLFHSGAIKKLKGNMFQVYITIAMHLDTRGEGWPTQQRIADLLDLSRNTVGTAIKQLEKDGFITREKIRTSGKFDNTIYKIKFAPQNHAQKIDTVETPENQGLNHAQDLSTVTMPNSSAPSFQHEELGTKKDPSLKKDFDDDAERISNIWDDDFQYKTLREMFTAIGASDITKYEEHHKKFKEVINKIGFGQVVLAAEKYIALNGVSSQIVYFLSGHYNQYIEVDKPSSKGKNNVKVSKVESAREVAMSEIQLSSEELAATLEDIEKTKALLRSTEQQVLNHR
jgi:DNA-binding Lrp family transcriptional regulator